MKDFTNLQKEDFNDILSNYAIGEYKSHKYIAWALENYVYIVKTTKGKYIVKLLNNIKREDFAIQLEFINFLHSKNFPVAKNLLNKDHIELATFNKKPFVVQEFIEGKAGHAMGDKLTLEMAKQIGTMHEILLHSKFKVKKYQTHYKQKKYSCLKNHPIISKNYKELIKTLNSLSKKNLRAAHAHKDLTEVNFLVKNYKLKAIIDFDDSNPGFIVFDLAVFLAHAFACKKRIQKKRMKLFLQEYQKHNSLHDDEKKALYFLIFFRLFGILNWYDHHLKSHPKDKKNMLKGINRNLKVVSRYQKFPIEEFLSLF